MTSNIVILCGPRDGYGYCPVPPMTDSAPEQNIFRLAEHDYGEELKIHVLSACSRSQIRSLQKREYLGSYHHIVLPEPLLILKTSRLLQNKISEKFCMRWCHTQDLFSWIYLLLAGRQIRKLDPDLLLINSLPQYILPIRAELPHIPLGLFVRGEMGKSRKYLPLVDFVITNSPGMATYVRNLLGESPVPVLTIPNSIERLHGFDLHEEKQGQNKSLIYVGRIEEVKGVAELLKAFHLVQQRLPDARLTIIGGNYGKRKLTKYEQEIFEFSRSKRLNAEFMGRIPHDLLPHHYAHANIAIFPSICLESFGMVALEAMRCSLPVIASRRPGFEELIIDGETGILIDDPKDIEALAVAIMDLLLDPQKAQKMGRRGLIRSFDYEPIKINEQFRNIVLDFIKQG